MEKQSQKKLDIYAIVEDVTRQVTILEQRLRDLESENQELRTENAGLKEQTNGAIPVNSGKSAHPELAEVKRKLEKYVREIDQCIAQLEAQ